MLYNLGPEKVAALANTHLMPEFSGAEAVIVSFETDPVLAGQVLPRPLSLAPGSQALAFVARYPETNFGCVYNEGALFLICEYKGERGLYCLSMPVDDDMALILGREYFGYPKKMAESISLTRSDDQVTASVIRKGAEIIRIECRLTGEAPERFMGDLAVPAIDWNAQSCQKAVMFLFKHFPSPAGGGFDYLPRLVREPVLLRSVERPKACEGSLKLGVTKYDPLGEITVGKITNMVYGKFHNTMLPGRVVARTWNPLRFARHAFFSTDMAVTLLEQSDPQKARRAKAARDFAKRL